MESFGLNASGSMYRRRVGVNQKHLSGNGNYSTDFHGSEKRLNSQLFLPHEELRAN